MHRHTAFVTEPFLEKLRVRGDVIHQMNVTGPYVEHRLGEHSASGSTIKHRPVLEAGDEGGEETGFRLLPV